MSSYPDTKSSLDNYYIHANGKKHKIKNISDCVKTHNIYPTDMNNPTEDQLLMTVAVGAFQNYPPQPQRGLIGLAVIKQIEHYFHTEHYDGAYASEKLEYEHYDGPNHTYEYQLSRAGDDYIRNIRIQNVNPSNCDTIHLTYDDEIMMSSEWDGECYIFETEIPVFRFNNGSLKLYVNMKSPYHIESPTVNIEHVFLGGESRHALHGAAIFIPCRTIHKILACVGFANQFVSPEGINYIFKDPVPQSCDSILDNYLDSYLDDLSPFVVTI